MRTVTTLHLEGASLVPKSGADPDAAGLDLAVALLLQERLVSPPSNPLLGRDQILAAFRLLTTLAQDSQSPIPTDPESKLIRETAQRTLEQFFPIDKDRQLALPIEVMKFVPESEEAALRYKALRHALSIIAQLPEDKRDSVETDLRLLIQDRDDDAFGLLFQQGSKLVIRLRHRNPEALKASTERIVNALSPRSSSEITEVISRVPTIDRAGGRFAPRFEDIEMKTPSGEPAQTGRVHAVSSQSRLLFYLARQPPQSLLVIVTVLLLAVDLLLELRYFPDWRLRGLSMRTWSDGIFGRLATAAFGAYLVALFLRFADLRGKLRGSSKRDFRISLRGRAYGAFIEWRID